MKKKIPIPILMFVILAVAACGLLEGEPPPASPSSPQVLPTETQTSQTPASPTALPPEPAPTSTSSTSPDGSPLEAIWIQEPASGSRLVGPFRLVGEAGPTDEQILEIRLVDLEGQILLETSTSIQAGIGQRGRFELEINFPVPLETQVFLQVFSRSPRDGGIIHLTAAGLRLAPDGPQEVRRNEPHAERIQILTPDNGQAISGGTIRIEGIALASFEQHLTAEVLDQDGRVVGSSAITVAAPDLGQPGPFRVDVSYQLQASGPGRVVVRDPSPAFPGDVHLSSVEVALSP
jgi:hypothetical protein